MRIASHVIEVTWYVITQRGLANMDSLFLRTHSHALLPRDFWSMHWETSFLFPSSHISFLQPSTACTCSNLKLRWWQVEDTQQRLNMQVLQVAPKKYWKHPSRQILIIHIHSQIRIVSNRSPFLRPLYREYPSNNNCSEATSTLCCPSTVQNSHFIQFRNSQWHLG